MQTLQQKRDGAELMQSLYQTAFQVEAEEYLKYVGFTREELDTHCADFWDLWHLYQMVSKDLGFNLHDILD